MRQFYWILMTLPICIGCAGVNFADAPKTTAAQSSASGTLDQICNPFGGTATAPGKGLIGTLHYMDPGTPHPQNLGELYATAVQAPTSLVLSQINVPTRNFTAGFSVGTSMIEDASGQIMTEWFGIKMHTVLTLSSNQLPGYYQFKYLADDGALLLHDDTNEVIVDNDGIHAPLEKCGINAIAMDTDTHLPLRVEYFQGPRTQIALVLYWRRVAVPIVSDCASGLSGGWSVVPEENFNLPADAVNTCH